MSASLRTPARIALALLLSASFGLLSAGAASKDDDRVVSKSKVRIVRTDDGGESHAETFEFDSETPQPFLGVVVEERGAKDGVRILQVIDDSAAARAGLASGDVIVRFGGDEVESSLDLTRFILRGRPGDSVAIVIERDGATRTLTAELGESEHGVIAIGPGGVEWGLGDLGDRLKLLELPEGGLGKLSLLHWAGDRRPRLGVELVQPTAELREHFGAPAGAGVIVGKVLAGMPADVSGVRVGDVIVAADGNEIDRPEDLIEVLDNAEGRAVRLVLIRDGREMTLDVDIPVADDEAAGPRA